MNDEELTSVPDDGAEGQEETLPEASSQTEEVEASSQPAAAETAPALSLAEVQRLLDERETRLRAEFVKTQQAIQSKTDKAYARALAETKVLEQHAERLGLEPEQLKNLKRDILDEKFAEVEKEAANPLPAQVPSYPVDVPTVTRTELESYVREQLGDAAALDVTQWVGLPNIAGQDRGFMAAVANAKKAKANAAASAKRTEVGKQVADTRKAFGTTAAPSSGAAPSSVQSLEQEYQQLVQRKTVPQAERMAYQKRLAELEEKLTQLGRM